MRLGSGRVKSTVDLAAHSDRCVAEATPHQDEALSPRPCRLEADAADVPSATTSSQIPTRTVGRNRNATPSDPPRQRSLPSNVPSPPPWPSPLSRPSLRRPQRAAPVGPMTLRDAPSRPSVDSSPPTCRRRSPPDRCPAVGSPPRCRPRRRSRRGSARARPSRRNPFAQSHSTPRQRRTRHPPARGHVPRSRRPTL